MTTPLQISIRRAASSDVEAISAILLEANGWLEARNMRLWTDAEINFEGVAKGVAEQVAYLAECDGEAAGTLKLEMDDAETWPGFALGEAAYVHRFAVRRKFAGGQVSRRMIEWAIEETRRIERPFIRLDCEAHRPRLREFYQSCGFKFHSEIVVQGFLLARFELSL